MTRRTPLPSPHRLALAAAGLAAVLSPQRVMARPTAPSVLCDTYPDAAACAGELASCATCHTSTWPAAWNDYGLAVLGALGSAGGTFEAALPGALRSLDALDSDGDGVANADELLIGSSPGDPDDAWPWCPPAAETGAVPVDERYDFRSAARPVSVLYCGRQPTYDELAMLEGGGSREERYERLHAALSLCLSSAEWRVSGLRRLVDARIRPIGAVGAGSPVGIVIGDYDWDYRLFRYVMSEDRDVRELLLADYHVTEPSEGVLQRVEGVIEPTLRSAGSDGQPLPAERRAGMITTSWFFSVNTMFSALPRTTAAQAYRAWLGLDIARQEGLVPVVGEPLDVDGRGVTSAQCASCHSTLDPLSYAFAYYEGIRGPRTGAYDPTRPARLIPGWDDPATVLMGTEVEDVRAWAERAVESEAFARNLAEMLFADALGRAPTPSELAELREVWRALPEDGWSANRMIHRLVDTTAFAGRTGT